MRSTTRAFHAIKHTVFEHWTFFQPTLRGSSVAEESTHLAHTWPHHSSASNPHSRTCTRIPRAGKRAQIRPNPRAGGDKFTWEACSWPRDRPILVVTTALITTSISGTCKLTIGIAAELLINSDRWTSQSRCSSLPRWLRMMTARRNIVKETLAGLRSGPFS